jgi:hypothetical protein
MQYRYQAPHVLTGKFAGDMSHCPSKLNNATKALLWVSNNLRATTNCIDHGLFKDQQKTTKIIAACALFHWATALFGT